MAVLYADEKKYPDNAMRQNFIFLAYPFSPPLPKEDYGKMIKEIEAILPVRLWYFLDEVTSLEMMRKIWRAILRSDMAFFDITNGNPNVAFELGLALASDKRSYAILKTGEGNPLGKADLGYAEYSEYDSISSLKDKIISTLKSKSTALKILKEIAYEIFESSAGITHSEYESAIVSIMNQVFKTKTINRNTARSLLGGKDALAGTILQALRAKGILNMTGANKHSKYELANGWVYMDHEVSGD